MKEMTLKKIEVSGKELKVLSDLETFLSTHQTEDFGIDEDFVLKYRDVLKVLCFSPLLDEEENDEAFIRGKDKGYNEGYEEGYDHGYDDGVDDGYSEGYDDGCAENDEEDE